MLFPTTWASAASATAHGVSVCSSVQSRKLDRKPWTVARSARPVDRRTLVMCHIAKGLALDAWETGRPTRNHLPVPALACSTSRAASAQWDSVFAASSSFVICRDGLCLRL